MLLEKNNFRNLKFKASQTSIADIGSYRKAIDYRRKMNEINP